jgi:hypothetical protein
MQACVRRTEQAAESEAVAAEHRFELAESVEPGLAVIVAHAACAYPAERQILGGDVQQRIV